ncbi:16S rRNA (guanine(527)-N(7))-methyltransferase RsmG [Camelimonas abortus]|uniref:Ribosomal RNA small subunit methyltransferase G n=1 Tax=Camelimonas abortus TaxID=1017184 RepID=A0ABV7LCR2_9HYPH
MTTALGPSSQDLNELHDLGLVSRETIDRLRVYVQELERWQRAKNLVSAGTLTDVWKRHIIDSAQLWSLGGGGNRWLDLGSGGGLPGIVLGVKLAETGGEITLVEANARKCAFLRHVIRCTDIPARVVHARIESCIDSFAGRIDVVTARALAPLAKLLEWNHDLLRNGAIALFPKGQDVASELTEASRSWSMDVDLIPSRTNPSARIVRIRSVREAG